MAKIGGLIRDIAIAVIIIVIIGTFIKPTIVKESSMQPTLYENNYILINKQAYRFGELKKGDIIVFHSDLTTDDGKEKLLIKRIIGLPGQTITIKGDKVYINGKEIKESYTAEGMTPGEIDNYKIPKGYIFVMGDNRRVSIDSRSEDVGCVKVDRIVGKAFVRLWPFNDICLL